MLFFTTDLDARLLHFNNFHFTRNLIVGSSYGLTLRDRYQRTSGIAAFRDSGQTAAYVACRLAISADHSNVRSASSVNPDELGVILPEQVRKSIRAPLLFEVGREVAATLSPLSQDADSLHPAPFRAVNASNAFLTFIAVTLFLAMAVYVFPPIRNRISSMAYAALEPFGWRPANDPLHQVIARPEWHQRLRDRRKYLLWAVGGIGFLTSLALAVAIYHSHFGGGEPFAITAGYSTWPSIIINQIAFVLTLFFFVEAWYTIRYTECRLDHEFHLHGERVAARGIPAAALSMVAGLTKWTSVDRPPVGTVQEPWQPSQSFDARGYHVYYAFGVLGHDVSSVRRCQRSPARARSICFGAASCQMRPSRCWPC